MRFGSKEHLDALREIRKSLESTEPVVEESYALRPLTTYCDKHPAAVTGYRLGGRWHIRIQGVTGVAVTFEAAVADAMNKLFVAEQGEAVGR